MIKSFGHFLATYLATGAATYGLGHSPVPLALSYAWYFCSPPIEFYPLDGLSVCGFAAGLLAGFGIHRLPSNASEKAIKDIDRSYMWKMITLSMLGMIVVYRAYLGVTTACGDTLADAYRFRIATRILSNSVVYSVLNAAIGYLFFDLRRYRFEVGPWRPQ